MVNQSLSAVLNKGYISVARFFESEGFKASQGEGFKVVHIFATIENRGNRDRMPKKLTETLAATGFHHRDLDKIPDRHI